MTFIVESNKTYNAENEIAIKSKESGDVKIVPIPGRGTVFVIPGEYSREDFDLSLKVLLNGSIININSDLESFQKEQKDSSRSEVLVIDKLSPKFQAIKDGIISIETPHDFKPFSKETFIMEVWVLNTDDNTANSWRVPL